jgi:hypothetical protein
LELGTAATALLQKKGRRDAFQKETLRLIITFGVEVVTALDAWRRDAVLEWYCVSANFSGVCVAEVPLKRSVHSRYIRWWRPLHRALRTSDIHPLPGLGRLPLFSNTTSSLQLRLKTLNQSGSFSI